MKGRREFSKDEADRIRRLLRDTRVADRSSQKILRGQLRQIGFYIRDWSADTSGFTRSDFDDLVGSGMVLVDDSGLVEVGSKRRSAPSSVRAPTSAEEPSPADRRADLVGHQATEDWMGDEVVTLADLLRPGLRGVVIGINPSPVSVEAGHYYQGTVGQRFFRRLEEAGVLPRDPGWEDERAFAAGLGFTDVIKRPTPRASGIPREEFDYGRRLLEHKLVDLAVPRILFTFKRSATALLGPFEGHGLRPGRPLAGAEVFVMPGPMAKLEHVKPALAELRSWWSQEPT